MLTFSEKSCDEPPAQRSGVRGCAIPGMFDAPVLLSSLVVRGMDDITLTCKRFLRFNVLCMLHALECFVFAATLRRSQQQLFDQNAVYSSDSFA